MTPAQLAIAWVQAKQPTLLPTIGARTRSQLDEALGALDKTLSAADVSALEAIVSISGPRYPEQQMQHLDSER
jgi:aryl-alcohol dehydrogenase-like predicted oxidoreductase